MTDPVIHAEQLVKKFGAATALNQFDLTVNRGEVMGFLGPNGAGKSTTIRVLLGLLQATSGTAEVFGQDPWRDAVSIHRRLAYVPGDVTLWPGLTGGQCLDVLASAHGGTNEARRKELIDRFDLDPKKKSRSYSKGNRQKVSLIAALALDVDLLIFDEPTSGLDPLMEAHFQAAVRERINDGATVLLSSHILSEVETLADRVTIIREGKTVLTSTIADLQQQTATHVHAVCARPPESAAAVGAHHVELKPVAGGTELRCTVDGANLPQLVGVLHTSGVQSLTITPPSLDELFMSAYSDAGDSGDAA